MRYLKTFESFAGGQEDDCAQIASEILAMAGEEVTPQEIEQAVEDSLEKGEDEGQSTEEVEGKLVGESVNEFLTWWWDLMSQTAYSHDTLEYEMTLPALGAWLATLVTGGGVGYAIYKVGKAIKGLFGGKEVDYTEFVEKWCRKNGVELTKVDLKTEEGKAIMARMLADFKSAGGKI